MCDHFCGAAVLNGRTSCSNKAVQYTKKRDFSSDWDYSERSEGEVDHLEVIGEGTNLMESLKFPTVLVRVLNADLAKSTVYYVLLESHSEDLPIRIIPAIMLSDPSSAWRTQFAELFPLSVEVDSKGSRSMTPLLCRTRYKQLFLNGSSFKVLALESGRLIESSENLPWNQWKLNLPMMRSMITEFLYKDIRQMPVDIIERATHSRTRTNSHSCSSTSVVSLESSSSQDSPKRVLSAHYPNLRFPGIAASGGSSFAKWFRVLPPDVCVDQNFKCDRGTTLRKDTFADAETLYRYLNLSETA